MHSVHPFIYPVHGSNVSLLSIHGLMKHEMFRMCSYNQQITRPIYSVIQLAQNGFYCSGQNGEVTCFNCERRHPNFLFGLPLDETSHMRGCDTTREVSDVPFHNGTGGLTSADLDLFYQGNSSSFSNLDTSIISRVIIQTERAGQTGQSGTNSTTVASQSASTALVGETHDGVPSSQDNVTAIGDQGLPSGDNTEHDSFGSSTTGGKREGVTLEPDVVLRLVEKEHNYHKKRVKCMQCGNRKIGCIYLPCGHVVACQPCGDDASTCIRCGKVIAANTKIYLS